MAIVFVLGLICSSLLERRAEVVSVFNNKRTMFTDSIVAPRTIRASIRHGP